MSLWQPDASTAKNLLRLAKGSLFVAGVFWVLGILAPFVATLVIYGMVEVLPKDSTLAMGVYMVVAMLTMLLAMGALGLAFFGGPVLHLVGAISSGVAAFKYEERLRGGLLLLVHGGVLLALLALFAAAALAPALPDLPEMPELPQSQLSLAA